jgi:hypothetical protein
LILIDTNITEKTVRKKNMHQPMKRSKYFPLAPKKSTNQQQNKNSRFGESQFSFSLICFHHLSEKKEDTIFTLLHYR